MTSGIDAVAGVIRRRITVDDDNYMLAIVGDTGKGKSGNALSLASKIDPTFAANVKNRVVFTPEDFMKRIKEFKDERKKGTNIKGRVLMFDEAGVGIPAREWQRIQNRLMGYVTQLFRYLNLCIIFTVPSMSFIDKQVKILMHGIIECKYRNKQKGIATTKFWVIKHNPVFDTTDLEPFIIFDKGNHRKIDPLYIPHPEEHIWNPYLELKEGFGDSYFDKAFKDISGTSDGTKIRQLQNKAKALDKALPIVKEGRTWKEVSTILDTPERTLMSWRSADTATAAT